MSVAPALTAPELAALAGPSLPRWYMVFDTSSGNVVATAQVDTGVLYPVVSLPVTNTSAGWGNIQYNQAVLIGSTPGGFDKGIFRVRKTPGSATTLSMSATGLNDSGAINLATHNLPIATGDYVTVLNRFDPFGVLPRIDYSGTGIAAPIYEDYDNTGYIQNRYPPPIVNITIDGQSSNYATHVYGGTSKTFNITANITLWPTSASVTWAWTLPAGWTLNSGALTGSGTTSTINVTAPHSANTYTLQFAATENNGAVMNAYRKVWICSNTYPPLSIPRFESDVDDRTGSRRTITLTQLLNMPPGALVHLFDMGLWNGTDVPTARKCFTGYVEKRKEITDIGVTNITLDLIGPSYMLDLLGGQSQILSAVNSTPTTWQQVYYTLSYLDFIIWWVLYQRASGFLQMFNYTSFGLSNTQKRMTDWRIDTGTLLSQLKALAVRYGSGNFGCDPTGEFMLRRHVSRIPWANRGSVPVRDTLTPGRFKYAALNYQPRPLVRRLRGEAFYSDGLTTNTPVWCDAPPIPGQGGREEKIDRLVVDTAGELYELTGNEYQARNNPYPSGTIKVPKNYAVIYPAQMARLGLNIPANLRPDGVAYSGYVLPTQVSYTHNADGTMDTEIQVEAETVGMVGTDVPIPSPDTGLNAQTQSPSNYYQRTPFILVPPYRSQNPNPAGTNAGATSLPQDGSVAFCGEVSHAYVASNFLNTPFYRDVTPGDLATFLIQHGMVQTGGHKAWQLGYDGTNSAVWYTPNLFLKPTAWTKGGTIAGQYKLVRPSDTAGDILIYTPFSTTTSFAATVTFDAGSYPYTPIYGTLTTGGNPGNCLDGGPSSSNCNSFPGSYTVNKIEIDLGASYTVTRLLYDHKESAGGSTGGTVTLLDAARNTLATYSPTYSGGTTWTTWDSGAISVANVKYIQYQNSACGVAGYRVYLDNCVVQYTAPGGGSASVANSADNGVTWAAPLSVGASPGASGGFDVQHNGTVSIAAYALGTKKATTLGGAYSPDQTFATNPVLVLIPWYTRNSLTTLNTGASPDYIVGLDAADAGVTLLWISGGAKYNITPSIGGVYGIAAGPNSLCSWKGKYLALLASFAGVVHLVTSIDGGTTWVDRGALLTKYSRLRRLAPSPGQLYLTGAANAYSASFGASLVNKTKPSSADLIFFEPVG